MWQSGDIQQPGAAFEGAETAAGGSSPSWEPAEAAENDFGHIGEDFEREVMDWLALTTK
jgi:hypothetical protein